MSEEQTIDGINEFHDYAAAVKRLSEMANAPAGTIDQAEFEMTLALVNEWQEAHPTEAGLPEQGRPSGNLRTDRHSC